MASTTQTVTMRQMSQVLAEENEMSRKQIDGVLDDFVRRLVSHLKKGERVRVPGLGIFQVRWTSARKGRNPATGETIQIKAKKKVTLRVFKELKASL